MNLIKSSVEEWVQENSLQGAYKQIEKAARVCYKSDLGKNPAEFVDRLVSNGHMAMLEHGIIYLRIEYNYLACYPALNKCVNRLILKDGLKPEEARDMLPLSTKTELVMTGFLSDWQHFIDLRSIGSTGRPHPEAKKLADQVKEILYGSTKA